MIRIPAGKERSLDGVEFIDLFAGIGGFHFAMGSFGAKCVFASEINEEAQDTYEANHGMRPAGDITQIPVESIPRHDVICGGFPCQAFSLSGKREGFRDIRGSLFFEIARIARHHKPRLIFLENVENFARHDGGETLRTVRRTLVELGYDCYGEVLCASAYGVPHARNRLYMLAIRKDLGFPGGFAKREFKFPEATNERIYLRDIMLPPSHTEKYIRHNLKNIDMRFDSEPAPALNPIQIGTVGSGMFGLNGRQGERIYHPNGHSITLTAAGGGPGKSTGLYKVNGSIRNLAPLECARLMGMPESFKINETERTAYRQAGNGVVVDVLQHIILSIIDQIGL